MALEWFGDDLQRGNQIYKWITDDKCSKEYKYVTQEEGFFFNIDRAEYTGQMISNN